MNGQFHCSACGKEYRWKPELAGKKARCKCGQIIVCPLKDPSDQEEEIFDVAPAAEPKPVQRVAVAPASAIPVETIRGNSAPAKPLAYAPVESAVEKHFPNPLMDLWAPLWVFAIASAIEIAYIALDNGSIRAMPFAMVILFAYVAAKTVMLSAGMVIAARLRQIKLGSLPSALLKLLALSIAPSATMDLLSIVTSFIPLGFILNWVCGFVIYFALIGTFFELDQEDTWYCVKIVFIINVAMALIFMWITSHR